MFKKLLVVFSVVATSACTTIQHVPMSAESSSKLQGKSLAVAQYPMPDFAAFTAGKAAFGMVGGMAMIAEGNSIIRENGIDDPARKISRGLAEQLVATRAMQLKPRSVVEAPNDEIGTLVSLYPGADYLLDIKTFGWMFSYYPTDWAHYRVTYSARLRLIETSSKRVVAETLCSGVQGDDQNPPSKDQLLENQAALLKTYFDRAADNCVQLLARDILQLPVATESQKAQVPSVVKEQQAPQNTSVSVDDLKDLIRKRP